MRHNITLEGKAFRLRPVTTADSEFIVALRNDPSLNRYINTTSHDIDAHNRWIEDYYGREGDFYFVVERRSNRMAEGTAGIYFLDDRSNAAEWGRWILRPGSMAALESAWLVYRTGFEVLDLDLMYCRTLADNASVLSFHESCGCIEHARLKNYLHLRGKCHDAVEQRMSRDVWDRRQGLLEAKLERFARAVAR